MRKSTVSQLGTFMCLIFAGLFVSAFCSANPQGKPSARLAASQQGKIKIAVLGSSDFFPDRVVRQRIGLPEGLAARVIEHLQRSQRFNVLERTALRKIINEQQFGQGAKESFLDRTLNANIGGSAGVSGDTYEKANYNDIVKEYQNLGTSMGADFLVFAVLEKANEQIRSTAIPYSQKGKRITKHLADARVRLRVVASKTGSIVGTSSFRTKVSESVFEGRESDRDPFSTFDHVGTIAARKILDIISPAKIVSAEPYVINRGTNDGFSEGTTFKVLREGKEVLDSTGMPIGRIKSPAGSIKLASVQETISVVEVTDGSVQIGDVLELKDSELESGKRVTGKPKRTSTDGKLTIAVGKVHFNLGGDDLGYVFNDAPRTKNDLMVKLTNTNRFDVLERQEIDQVLEEKNFTALMAGGEIDPYLQETIGADYLVLTMVDKFGIRTERKEVPYLDEIQVRHFGIVEATLRIVDSHSGKLLGADKIRFNERLQTSGDQKYDDLIDRFTTEIVSRIVQRLYPIKILATLDDGSFYINRGQDGGLESGDLFNVMRPGEEMIDPDTGISFGSSEMKVAKAKLYSVDASRARARVIDGGNVQRGDILREAQERATSQPKVKINKPNF